MPAGDKNASSSGYKINLDAFQTPLSMDSSNRFVIPTNGGYHLKPFTIGANQYVAAVNIAGDDVKIYKFDSTNNTFDNDTGDGQSDIDAYQTISSMTDPTKVEFFTIGSDSYIAIANYYSSLVPSYNTNSKIYKWNTSTLQFDFTQNVAINGCYDVKKISIPGEGDFLAFASYYGDSPIQFNTTSKIYKWNTSTSTFDSYQSISTVGANNIDFTTIGSNYYLAISFGRGNQSGTVWDATSKVYKWNTSTHQFDVLQSISTGGAATQSTFFTIGTDNYLLFVNYASGSGSSDYTIDSKIYKWNSTNLNFDTASNVQNIATDAGQSAAFFNVGSKYYLAIGQHNGTSSGHMDQKVFTWNGSDFTTLSSLNIPDAYRAGNIENMTINGHHYLTVPNYSNNGDVTTDSYIQLAE